MYEKYTQTVRHNTKESHKVHIMEDLIKSDFDLSPWTGTMRMFIGWVKAVHAAGERFIIVSDKLFPLVLTYSVYLFLLLANGRYVEKFSNSK